MKLHLQHAHQCVQNSLVLVPTPVCFHIFDPVVSTGPDLYRCCVDPSQGPHGPLQWPVGFAKREEGLEAKIWCCYISSSIDTYTYSSGAYISYNNPTSTINLYHTHNSITNHSSRIYPDLAKNISKNSMMYVSMFTHPIFPKTYIMPLYRHSIPSSTWQGPWAKHSRPLFGGSEMVCLRPMIDFLGPF